jgi:hypothetical protein
MARDLSFPDTVDTKNRESVYSTQYLYCIRASGERLYVSRFSTYVLQYYIFDIC